MKAIRGEMGERRGASRTDRSYEIEGSLLESCSCRAPCPCWIGADPDADSCQGFNAYHIERGTIDGVDVSGCDFLRVFDIPGSVLTVASWRQVFVVDIAVSERQRAAILAAYSGEFGGPLADLARLVRETCGVERARIEFELVAGSGSLRAGQLVEVSVRPYRGTDGTVTTLHDSLMAGAPRAPAHIAQAEHHIVALGQYGFQWTFAGRSAIQSDYRVASHV